MEHLKSFFLGPYGENTDILLSLINEVILDHSFWRKNFHPEDGRVIEEKDKQHSKYIDSISKLKSNIFFVLQQLKQGIPFHSTRYMGHMLSDITLPSIIGYISTMLYNPNNVTSEASPITTKYEIEVGKQFAKLFGFDKETAWGHLTSGGTVANIEALWVARNLKYYPIAIQNASKELGLNFKVKDNISPDEILELREQLAEKYFTKKYPYENFKLLSSDYKQKYLKEIDNVIGKYTLSNLGYSKFIHDNKLNNGVILVPKTKHYSLIKAMDLLGIGKANFVGINIDKFWRMDIDDLKHKLKHYHKDIIMVVGVLGSTEEGGIDNIKEIINLKEKYKFYFHVDGAYGGYLATLIKKANDAKLSFKEFDSLIDLDIHNYNKFLYENLTYLNKVDSITIDPHKLGFIPYPAGGIVFKNSKIRELISVFAPYVFHEDSGLNFIGQFILEGSKPGAVATSVYLSHKTIGLNINGYGAILRNTIISARKLYFKLKDLKVRQIKIIPIGFPDTNIICFCLNYINNKSLKKANNLTNEVFKELSFIYGKPMNQMEYIISKTDFNFKEYNSSGTDELLKNMGIPKENYTEFPKSPEQDNKISILRMTLMNPWLNVNIINNKTPIEGFVLYLEKILKRFSLKVLLIEDEDKFIKLISKVLQQVNPIQTIDINILKNKKDALDFIKTSNDINYDLVIIDLKLPINNKSNEYETLAGVKIFEEVKKRYKIPIIIYTIIPKKDIMTKLKMVGFNDKIDNILEKPKKEDDENFVLNQINLYREIFSRINKA